MIGRGIESGDFLFHRFYKFAREIDASGGPVGFDQDGQQPALLADEVAVGVFLQLGPFLLVLLLDVRQAEPGLGPSRSQSGRRPGAALPLLLDAVLTRSRCPAGRRVTVLVLVKVLLMTLLHVARLGGRSAGRDQVLATLEAFRSSVRFFHRLPCPHPAHQAVQILHTVVGVGQQPSKLRVEWRRRRRTRC